MALRRFRRARARRAQNEHTKRSRDAPTRPSEQAFKVLDYPRLGMRLVLGQVYTLAELELRCGRREPKRRKLLYAKLADRTLFKPVSLQEAVQGVDKRLNAPKGLAKWARLPALCPTVGAKDEVGRRRRIANDVARDVLKEGRKIVDRDVLLALQAWGFSENRLRQNVIPQGQDFVHSDTVGLTRNRSQRYAVASLSKEFPDFTMLLVRWLLDNWPPAALGKFPVTSISINSQYAARRHRDRGNVGPSVLKCFGSDFTGGHLRYWPKDIGHGSLDNLLAKDSVVLDAKHKPRVFNGKFAHEVTPFEGERFSLVYFCVSKTHLASCKTRKQLEKLGFLFPTKENLRSAQTYMV
eukprot:gnl/TRDRNA2_/TRDRNA2_32927_c0_seq1.p1 gnl/TRDRNA2_/TRDRNA2_32927_c0~~gnl/TRDRNA2_/TRDRNA2_32927_c0_seq1.p1  ORF type:complete len:352 (+),score=36.58 gnl/TRDRNA2_/TRDRNA2_32927_c0_seq1:46-1101(+)